MQPVPSFQVEHVERDSFPRKITGAVKMMGRVTVFIPKHGDLSVRAHQANSTLENSFSFICQYYVS